MNLIVQCSIKKTNEEKKQIYKKYKLNLFAENLFDKLNSLQDSDKIIINAMKPQKTELKKFKIIGFHEKELNFLMKLFNAFKDLNIDLNIDSNDLKYLIKYYRGEGGEEEGKQKKETQTQMKENLTNDDDTLEYHFLGANEKEVNDHPFEQSNSIDKKLSKTLNITVPKIVEKKTDTNEQHDIFIL